jgi:lactoylglutathione lyase
LRLGASRQAEIAVNASVQERNAASYAALQHALPGAPALTPAAEQRICRRRRPRMEYLHTMVRVSDLDQSLDFYCGKLGLQEVRRMESEQGRFTLVFLAAPGDADRARDTTVNGMGSPMIELTYNWDPEAYTGGRNFGHLAYQVEDIYALCGRLIEKGVTINRPPRDGRMAFVRSPDGISIELLQKGNALAPKEPWASMPNTGTW